MVGRQQAAMWPKMRLRRVLQPQRSACMSTKVCQQARLFVVDVLSQPYAECVVRSLRVFK